MKYEISTVDDILKDDIKIMALCEFNSGTFLLGTKNCEIIEFKSN